MTEPTQPNPGHAEAAAAFADFDAAWDSEPTPLADAALAFLRRSKYALDAMETVGDFLYLAGEDA